ncbi:hypothetical protein D9M68_918330 [compost metagenome]
MRQPFFARLLYPGNHILHPLPQHLQPRCVAAHQSHALPGIQAGQQRHSRHTYPERPPYPHFNGQDLYRMPPGPPADAYRVMAVPDTEKHRVPHLIRQLRHIRIGQRQ